ncbi:MAG: post-transcriptional regulator [Bacilli bacterium]|nr:post-transcriptional regulator [Bacilli bacterium]
MGNEEFYKLRKKMIPVLRTKVHELNKVGIQNVTGQEIWNYLVYAKWKNMKEISLSEMTNDILSLCVEQKEM